MAVPKATIPIRLAIAIPQPLAIHRQSQLTKMVEKKKMAAQVTRNG